MKLKILILGLLSLISFILSNGQIYYQPCELPPIPQTLDTGSQTVYLYSDLTENGQIFNSYNNTFSKGTGATLFSGPNEISVYNSGENIHVEYKLTQATSSFYIENCTFTDTIPTNSNTARIYDGGYAVLFSSFNYNYRIAIIRLSDNK
ncbi:hypothetical protein ACTA71_012490 [Dictyostelium dimigraforme]